ncbi:zinc finger protein 37 homolog [Bicyclus anynana]|uniref:Zinc finger protein 37 homolog n=1 Tax=Bicyclus anynana TaxID=110368 RepID=A0ABM3LJ87_BICAN|nr:zinc finger protein 37 homolog [Bicyclus anynana]
MLHNTGPFGPNDVPVNVNPQTNMTSVSGRMNIGNNINNLAKIPQQSPQMANPHFNLPDYPTYGLNMNAGLSPFQNFHHVGFQQNPLPQNSIHDSWQNNMLPMNLNMQGEHSMLGFPQYGKPDVSEQSFTKSMLNVPQVHTKAFHKQMGMDVNYHYNLNPSYRPYADYNLDLSSKTKSDDVRQFVDPNISKERTAPPHYSEQIDLSNKHKMHNFSRPYLDTSITKSVIPQKHDSGSVNITNDLSVQLQRSKDKHPYYDYSTSIKPQLGLDNRYGESELDLSKSLKQSTLNSNYQNLSADRFYKDQEMRPQSNDLLPKFQQPNNLNTNFPSVTADLRMYKDQERLSQNLEKILTKPQSENLNTSFPSISSDLRYYKDKESRSQNLEAILMSKTQKPETSNASFSNTTDAHRYLSEPKPNPPAAVDTLLKFPQNEINLSTNSTKVSSELRSYKGEDPSPQNLEKSLSKPQQPEKLVTSYQNINSDLRFYKDQDSRRRSLENTVKMIENILSHSSNSRKSNLTQSKTTEAQQNEQKEKSEVKDMETESLNKSDINNSNTTGEGDSSVDNLSNCDKTDDSNANTSNELDDNAIDDEMEMDDKNPSDDTESETDNLNNESEVNHKTNQIEKEVNKTDVTVKDNVKSESEESSSEEEDIKPEDLININDIKKEEKIDDNIVVKVEVVPSLVDMEHLNPFYRDVFGVQSEDTVSQDIIEAETSVTVAKEVIRNGAAIEGAYFECPHCSLYFNQPKRFLIHTKWHSFGLTNEKRMELQREKEMRKQLKKEARVIERMNMQEVSDISAPGRKFNCRDCDKVFFAKASLKNHRQRYHPTRMRDCKICGKTVLGWMALRTHMATHTCESGYQCDSCPKRFKHPHSLAKHRDTHLEKTHACPQCPKKFGSAMLLNVHAKTHERALRGATFRCTYCGKGFFESYSLQVHERTHRNERPYLCEICNTSFGTNSSLKRHLKVSHSTSKPFECATCHRSFISEAIRDRHAMRNHGNPEDFKFVCKQCPCKYLKLKDLRKHMYKVHPKGKRKKKDQSDTE